MDDLGLGGGRPALDSALGPALDSGLGAALDAALDSGRPALDPGR